MEDIMIVTLLIKYNYLWLYNDKIFFIRLLRIYIIYILYLSDKRVQYIRLDEIWKEGENRRKY